MRRGSSWKGVQRRLHLAVFASSFDRFTLPPLLVPIHESLGVTLAAASGLATAYYFAYGLSQLLWASVSDRLGRATVLRIAMAAGTLACVVCAVAQSFALLIAARVAAGFFFAGLTPTAITYVGDVVAHGSRQPVLARLISYSTAGIAAGTFVGGLAAGLLSWRAAFAASAGLALISTIAMWSLQEPERVRTHEARFRRQVASLLRTRWAVTVFSLAVVIGAVIFGALTYVAAALQRQGISSTVAGSAAAIFGIANVVTTPLVVRAIPHVAPSQLITGGAGLAAAGLAVATSSVSVITVAIAAAGLGAGFGFIQSTMHAWILQIAVQGRALAISLFATSIFVGGACAAAALAPLADHGRFQTLFAATAVAALGLALAGGRLRSSYGRSSEPSTE